LSAAKLEQFLLRPAAVAKLKNTHLFQNIEGSNLFVTFSPSASSRGTKTLDLGRTRQLFYHSATVAGYEVSNFK
jgi:hypothetical protein